MALPKEALRKARERLKKLKKGKGKKPSPEEIDKAYDELTSYVERMEEEERKKEEEEFVEGTLSKSLTGSTAEIEKKKSGIDISEASEEEIKNLPLEMQEIPEEYVSKMVAKWKPPKLTEIDKTYPLIEPFAYANLTWDEDEEKLRYTLMEPDLTRNQEKKLAALKDVVMGMVDVKAGKLEREKAGKMLDEKADKAIENYGIETNEKERDKLLYYMKRDFLGLGKIEPLMHDPTIEDISCDGIGIPIYIYHRKYASVSTNIAFEEDELNSFITKLAQKCGRHISVANPLLDGALPNGSRVQATYSAEKAIAMKGSTFTIRKFSEDPFTVTDMINFGTIPPLVAAYLWLTLEYEKTLLVSGGTASGKTCMLNALSMFLPQDRKIVSIEDTPEIRLPHEHWTQKVVRSSFSRGGEGGVSMQDLLRAALRERPDELIVGEVRGAEAYVLFQAMATGHPGLSTIHADSVDAVLHRLITPPIDLPTGLLQHLDMVMILTKARVEGIEVRRMKELVEIIGMRKGKPITNTIMKWRASDDTFEFSSDKSYMLQSIIKDKGIKEKSIWKEVKRREKIIEWMRKKEIRQYKEVGKIISQYYSNPEEVLKKIDETE